MLIIAAGRIRIGLFFGTLKLGQFCASKTAFLFTSLLPGTPRMCAIGEFDLVKRKLKQRNVISPSDMMRVVQDSSPSNKVVCSAEVD